MICFKDLASIVNYRENRLKYYTKYVIYKDIG